MGKFLKIKNMPGIGLILAMLMGCALQSLTVSPPSWDMLQSGMYETAEGRAFNGIGHASVIVNVAHRTIQRVKEIGYLIEFVFFRRGVENPMPVVPGFETGLEENPWNRFFLENPEIHVTVVHHDFLKAIC